MLAFRSGGSTGDVKNSLEFLDVRTSGRWVAVLLPAREAGDSGLLAPTRAVSLSVLLRKCTQLYVNTGGRVYCTNIVFRGKSVSVCDGPRLEHKHVARWIELRECLRKFVGELVWQNRVRVEAAELAKYTKAFRWVFKPLEGTVKGTEPKISSKN